MFLSFIGINDSTQYTFLCLAFFHLGFEVIVKYIERSYNEHVGLEIQ